MLNAQLRSVWGHTADLTGVGFGKTLVFVTLVFGSTYYLNVLKHRLKAVAVIDARRKGASGDHRTFPPVNVPSACFGIFRHFSATFCNLRQPSASFGPLRIRSGIHPCVPRDVYSSFGSSLQTSAVFWKTL